ncbi:hypothetical protein [Stenotrophomonas sp. VV52]|uniref:hypothetical protein n=1 Tax=Stenotrophomonas sp. VV52 TaxID=2066958 RepID=UPI0011AF8502|nr:hypothetical protein [Stenotrophomonas sp. VV52]
MSARKLYPHRDLISTDPESVLRWAGTWLSGEAAHHAELLRAAADAVAARETQLAELIAADQEFDVASAEHDESASYDDDGASVPKAVYERMKAASARRAAALTRANGGVA